MKCRTILRENCSKVKVADCQGSSPSDCVFLLRKIRKFLQYETCICYEALGILFEILLISKCFRFARRVRRFSATYLEPPLWKTIVRLRCGTKYRTVSFRLESARRLKISAKFKKVTRYLWNGRPEHQWRWKSNNWRRSFLEVSRFKKNNFLVFFRIEHQRSDTSRVVRWGAK